MPLLIPGVPGYGDNPYGIGPTSPYGDPYNPQYAGAIDHVKQGLLRVLQQYKESENFFALLTAILTVSNELEVTIASFFNLPNIDLMQGANLDTIGAIVGASRVIPNVVQLYYFGFDEGYFYMTPFGEEGIPGVGARFYEEGESFGGTSYLLDPEYRLVIRAKIIRNSSKGTGEDIIRALSFLFGSTALVTDNYDMSFSVAIGRPFTPSEHALLQGIDLLPRPAGVRVILP